MNWMAKAARAAKRLIAEYEISKPPVDVERLAKREGLRVVEEKLESEISGMLYLEGGSALILINQDDAPVRKRFSIAHELGHYKLHSSSSSVFVDRRVRFRDASSSQGTIKEEIEANNFAAELLMPEDFVLREVVRLRGRRFPLGDEELIEELANIFEVSRQAMEVRLANLGELGTC
ncbi:MAG TPA: ImmA/IrrE family metallo-endopeptidase [Thermoanaerobaculia bacterium]|jgi:Zn-dependent peptidase ImmA (M78 family)|nr:ImmA/IrrE family metallo-endopeptidase [Thermoanaerobaculia bacterium]